MEVGGATQREASVTHTICESEQRIDPEQNGRLPSACRRRTSPLPGSGNPAMASGLSAVFVLALCVLLSQSVSGEWFVSITARSISNASVEV